MWLRELPALGSAARPYDEPRHSNGYHLTWNQPHRHQHVVHRCAPHSEGTGGLSRFLPYHLFGLEKVLNITTYMTA